MPDQGRLPIPVPFPVNCGKKDPLYIRAASSRRIERARNSIFLPIFHYYRAMAKDHYEYEVAAEMDTLISLSGRALFLFSTFRKHFFFFSLKKRPYTFVNHFYRSARVIFQTGCLPLLPNFCLWGGLNLARWARLV